MRWAAYFILIVVVWTVLLPALCGIIAQIGFEVTGVILLLFPAVTIHTTVFKVTAIAVGLCFLLVVPKAALFTG